MQARGNLRAFHAPMRVMGDSHVGTGAATVYGRTGENESYVLLFFSAYRVRCANVHRTLDFPAVKHGRVFETHTPPPVQVGGMFADN